MKVKQMEPRDEILETLKAQYPDLPDWFAETVVDWYLKMKEEGKEEEEIMASLRSENLSPVVIEENEAC
jgi:hypothetical protein